MTYCSYNPWTFDMVGMGPYLEHHATPLYEYRHLSPFPSGKTASVHSHGSGTPASHAGH